MIGKTLAHYTIVEKIGKGGMGEVFRATDSKLGRDVALKILPESVADDEERRRRFEREARSLASLNHPNIVTVYSVERTDGSFFITMELVEGRPLSELIPKQGLPLARILEVSIPVSSALAAAHAQGITHRDLKPHNIVVSRDGTAKILDFGLAKPVSPPPGEASTVAATDESITGDGRIVGTAAYMSPEQAEGRPTDARSDIFSLGVVLYEMATGRRPFQGDSTPSLIASILRDVPKPVTESNAALPRDISRIIRRCLEKQPDRRYQTTRDLYLALDELRKDVESGEIETTATRDLARSGQRRRPGRLGWVALGLAVAAIALFAFLRDRSTSTSIPGEASRDLIRLSIEVPADQLATYPRLSADGTTLLYYDRKSGQYMLRQLDAFETQTVAGIGGLFGPLVVAFSPDSEWILFFRSGSNGATELARRPATEPEESSTVRVRDWPDTWSRGIVCGPGGDLLSMTKDNATLIRLASDGGDQREVPLLYEGPRPDALLPRSVLPDDHTLLGSAVYYQDQRNVRWDVITIDTETGEVRTILEDGAFAQWSPSGHVLFTRGTDLIAVPFDSESQEVRGTAGVIGSGLWTGSWEAGWFDLSPGGTLVNLTGGSLTAQVQFVVLDSTGHREPWDETTALYAGHHVSHDGRWVVTNKNGAIWVGEIRARGLVLLTDTPASPCAYPTWSADGRRVFYSRRTGDEESIQLHALDGRQEPTLVLKRTDDWDEFRPSSASPAGSALLLDARRGDAIDLLLVPLDENGRASGEPTIVASGLDGWSHASFSRDGMWIAYLARDAEDSSIRIRAVDEAGRVGRETRVVRDPGSYPVWSRDADGPMKLFYVDNSKMVSVVVSDEGRLRISPPREMFDLGGGGLITMVQFGWNVITGYDALAGNRFLFLEIAEPVRSGISVTLGFDEELRRRAGAAR
ncbi:serine/threonine protein kinase [bacterium]|nr:serine/threonine protein kinase [bacterium]